MTDQKESLYIKACVIANGLQDQQGDVITKQDIKRIFTNSLDVGFDIDHDNIRQEGVYGLEQYISKSVEMLGNKRVPAGSWMTVIRVDNPNVQEMIRKHEINGVSITAYPEKGTIVKRSHPKVVLYKDVQEKDKIHPKEISLVKKPSNLLPLEVMEYTDYISKSIKENTYMNETENEQISKSTTDKILDILQQLLPQNIQKGEEDPISATVTATPENEEAEVEESPVEEETQESDETNPEEIVDNSTTEVTEEEATEEGGETTEEGEETTEEGTSETEVEEETPEEEGEESVQKMMQPTNMVDQQGGTAEQAIVQIAQICARVLQGQQQQQQPQSNGIMQSEDPEPTEPIKKSQLQDKVTGKMDNVVSQDYVDRAVIFARQTGRDPVTGEKLYN